MNPQYITVISPIHLSVAHVSMYMGQELDQWCLTVLSAMLTMLGYLLMIMPRCVFCANELVKD